MRGDEWEPGYVGYMTLDSTPGISLWAGFTLPAVKRASSPPVDALICVDNLATANPEWLQKGICGGGSDPIFPGATANWLKLHYQEKGR